MLVSIPATVTDSDAVNALISAILFLTPPAVVAIKHVVAREA